MAKLGSDGNMIADDGTDSNLLPEEAQQPPWFVPEVPEPPAEFSTLLERKGIPPADVRRHIQTVRDKAWAVHKYPCIGEAIFMRPLIANNVVFPEVVDIMKKDPAVKLVDIGCGFAQDLRILEASGVSPSQLSGIDLDQKMIDFGYDLFNDRDAFAAEFQTGDMLTLSTSHPDLMGRFDVVHAACSLHLFDYETQKVAVENVMQLLKPGGLLFGEQLGRTEAKVAVRSKGLYVNDEGTFRKLFEVVGERLGLECKVSIQMTPMRGRGGCLLQLDPEYRVLHFSVQVGPRQRGKVSL